ncbi:hypothetical protein KQR54_18795 [Mycobacterium gordonae]|nr:hypothetical protein [Mycobacterium gordonae]
MLQQKLLADMKAFLDGDVSAELFSHNFPSSLVHEGPQLEADNPALSTLLNADLPDYCGWYEPDKVARSGCKDCLDDKAFRRKVQAVYDAAVKLVE